MTGSISGIRVEILFLDGCPSYRRAQAIVERVVADMQAHVEIELVHVADHDQALAYGFLGSPTVRVDGRDVQPGAEARRDYALSCRVYPSSDGFSGEPQEAWIRQALAEAR
jgi:hypothetical protein